jgi:hypothetical protein
MKATHNKAGKPDKVEWKFPCLGKINSAKDVVFFSDEKTGVVVYPDLYTFGEYSAKWLMDGFTPLPSTESVTLQND